ncbi:ATP-binding protein [Nocardioides sp. CN2-186]|uniref:ATP-binding protein n=1 Tax=Nocardioides tweenelious TaxID=3156607 RepID=UPI0032B4A539
MSNSGRRPVSRLGALLLLVAVFAAGLLAVFTKPSDAPAATWWPAAGIAVALLGMSQRRWWWWQVPALVAVTGAANYLGGRPLDLSLWFGVANATEAVVVAAFLLRGRSRLAELSTLDVLPRLAAGAVLGGITFATLAAAGVATLADASYLTTWRLLSISHAASTIVILPLAMAPPSHLVRRAAWEFPLQVVALGVATLAVFWPGQTLSLEFLPLALLLWAALRFGVRVVAWEMLCFAAVVTTMSTLKHGPFGFDVARGDLSSIAVGAVVQAYVLVAAVMTLPLAIGFEQSRSSERLFRRNFTESVAGMLLMRSGPELAFEITDINDAAAALLGDATTTVGRGLGDVLDTAEPLELIAHRMVAGNLEGWKSQCGVRGRPGSRVDLAVSLLNTEPEPMFAAQLLDVSAAYDAQRQLEAAEKLTSATLDTTAAMIIVTDLAGVVARINGAVTLLTGFSEQELVGTEIWDVPFAPPGAIGYPAGLPATATEQVSRETDLVTKAGERRRIRWNTGYVLDDRHRPTYTVLTGIDLTAERTAAGVNRHLLEAAITTALIGIDPHGLITVFNAGAVNLLGFDAQDTVGTPFVDLIDPEQLSQRSLGFSGEDAFMQLVGGIKGGGETAPRDWTWIGADGRRHTVSMTLSIASDTFAARSGYLCVGRDVTESRVSQEMLIAALEKERLAVQRMRELDAAKDEFVSTVSHELRTPVSSIVGYTEILEDGSVVAPAPEQLPLLASIARNGQRLIMICDDLLTLSGIDSGATRWERDIIDLTQILAGAEDSVRAHVVGRDLQVVYSATDDPVLVVGDRVQLERVVTNLLSNAIKFTPDGGRIEVSVLVVDGEASLSVSDSGIGIPEDEQANLFQRFFRSSSAQERAIQGTGLGLSIVAAVVAAHGGRIDVESAHLEGTTITVRLPLARG